MKALILAAGFGTRLRPLTNQLPKPLLPVGGIPLIEWNLRLLRAAGIREVIINLHYLGEMIESALGDGGRWNMRLTFSHEPEILGTGGGIKNVEWFVDHESFLVLNGDTLLDLNVRALLEFHQTRGGEATLVLRNDQRAEQWGLVECDVHDRILRINGKGVRGKDPPKGVVPRMFAGVHVLHPRLLGHEKKGTTFSIIDTYTRALALGSPLFGFVHVGYWSDIGTPERYWQAQADFSAGLYTQPL